jgi:hypothetical protein
MCGCGDLPMTGLLAGMLSTVEGATADVRTLKRANPLLQSDSTISCSVGLSALLLLCPVATHDVFLDLAAVTSCGNAHFASPTGTLVARS